MGRITCMRSETMHSNKTSAQQSEGCPRYHRVCRSRNALGILVAGAMSLSMTAKAVDEAQLISALSDFSFITVDGQAQRNSDVAKASLIAGGTNGLPLLVEAAGHSNVVTRALALETVYSIAEQTSDVISVLPVFTNALFDADVSVRQTAATVIGRSCLFYKATGESNELDQAAEAMVPALEDSSEDVSITAAVFLRACGLSSLVPSALLEESEGYGTELPPP